MEVSVIMPAYNAADFISDALSSILAQEFDGKFEVLVADDVSTDGTAAILSQFETKYPDVVHVFYNSKNLGCSANSDSLTRRAQGKYLAFCDADDIWTDSLKLKKQFEILEQHPEIGMCCMADAIQYAEKQSLEDVGEDGFFLSFSSLMHNNGDIVNSSVMCSRLLFEKMRDECTWYLDNKCFFDSVWAYWFSLYSKVWCMKEPVTLYRERSESDCRTTNEKKKYELDKRYYLIKTRFLISNGLDADTILDVLGDDYDFIYSFGKWRGETLVRNSHSYRLGKKLITPLKLIQK